MEKVVSVELLRSYYRNKKVFITGNTGFKGSWLMALLHTTGAQIKGYALAPEYDNSLFSYLQPLSIGETVIADIRNRDLLKKEITAFQPDFIFHLAAQPLVRRSYEIPAETFDINVTGTANVLEAMKSLRQPCTCVVVTTDKVYENKEQDILYTEEDRLGGHDPYSASKAAAEITAASFQRSFFSPSNAEEHGKRLATARAGNVIGGGDWNSDRLIPDIIRSLMAGKPVLIRNPDAIRPWQHVLEPLCGYLQLAGLLSNRSREFQGSYNFGPNPDDHLPVKVLADTAIRYWGKGSWEILSSANAPHEAQILKLDIGLARKDLGWIPQLKAQQAIEWTLDWYKQPDKEKASYTFEQINRYL
jgi:CDP-glucose 4,6-dehydratase